ncbi:MAG: hypothetical protein HS129_11365 [Leptospiraceae bacterium]|nr:hypothetical protein [Leptospiraceae bacterium]NUM42735.1 hypothetical protein [Leptospiraceae bacterium]
MKKNIILLITYLTIILSCKPETGKNETVTVSESKCFIVKKDMSPEYIAPNINREVRKLLPIYASVCTEKIASSDKWIQDGRTQYWVETSNLEEHPSGKLKKLLTDITGEYILKSKEKEELLISTSEILHRVSESELYYSFGRIIDVKILKENVYELKLFGTTNTNLQDELEYTESDIDEKNSKIWYARIEFGEAWIKYKGKNFIKNKP